MILGINIDEAWEKGQYLCKMSHVFSVIIKSFLSKNDKKRIRFSIYEKKYIFAIEIGSETNILRED